MESRRDDEGAVQILRYGQAVVRNAGRAGRDLVVVEGCEDVLGIAPVDAVAVPVEHVGIDEVRIRIDGLVVGTQSAADADHLIAPGRGDLEPHFVGVRRALGEGVPEGECPQHHFDDIFAARHQSRHIGSQGCRQRRVDGGAGADAEDVHPEASLEKCPVCFVDRIGKPEQVRERGVGGGEQVIVHGQRATRVVALRGEILGLLERHVATVAVLLRFGRIVEAGHAVAGDAAQEKRVVVVLAAQPLVVVQRHRQVHLVAGAAELRGLVQGLQEGALVQRRFRLDEKAVKPVSDGMLRT